MKKPLSILVFVGVVCQLLLAGCSLYEEDKAAQDSVSLQQANSLSTHYVEAVFSDAVDESMAQAENFIITDSNGAALSVDSASLREEDSRVLLATSAQAPVVYTLTANTATGAETVEFTAATSQPEPMLMSAIALSNTSVLLTFSAQMSRASAETAAYYRIAAPDDQAPRQDLDSVSILSAALGDNGNTVVLGTTPQQDLEYLINVTNVEDSSGELIDPTRNSNTFFGISPIDLTPPGVTSAVSISSTRILVSFREPVAAGCADPTHFTVSYCVAGGVPCADAEQQLVITDAEASNHDTQVLLTTLPQALGIDYTLTAMNCSDLAGNPLDLRASTVGFTFAGATELADDATPPRVVGAASTGNGTVIVTFTKAMAEGAEDARNYVIVQQNVNSEVGALNVTAATLGPDGTTVQLRTLSQNEVTYQVTVVNVRDTFGNHIAPKEFGAGVLIDPSVATFAGTPPTAAQLVDSDGDGLTDNEEQRGYTIYITTTSGEVVARQVTSNPFAADSDGDGISDYDELQYGFNPRSTDTDGDTLSDDLEFNVIFSSGYSADTDGDGLEDGLEYNFYHTSPLLADTDGDKQTDSEELLEFNRNPRIADLPSSTISIGEVRLQIDERYTFTDEQGQSISTTSTSNTTLARSSDTSFSRSDAGVNETSGGFNASIRGGISDQVECCSGFIQGEFAGHYEETHSTSWQTDAVSARQSQSVYEASLAKGKELTTTSTVTREIVGARIDVDLSIENVGDVAFTISNIEVTVLQRSPLDTSVFLPVATLVANSQLITGTPLAVNMGPFTNERGPFLFASRDVFPNLVDELLRSPSGLIFKVANFDITDEFGRNFSFSDQTARDRTAGVTIDFGDGGTERFLVATSGALDDQGYAGPPNAYVGGFDAVGAPLGLPLDYVLQDMLGLKKNDRSEDGIVAGLNKTADSIAQGDDVQVIPVGTTGLSVGSIVVSAGGDGILETAALVDDRQDFTSGYETSLTCSEESDNAGDICTPSVDQCLHGSCTGPERLVRVGSYRNGDFNRSWIVLASDRVPAAADFGRIVLAPREDIFLAFLQDLDQDGVFARDEFLAGSTDSSLDILDNSTFGLNFDENAPSMPDGKPDSKDTDRDGLGDFAEIFVGWKVSADGGSLVNVYSSPRLRDSDGDLLLDPLEADLRGFCAPMDPRTDSLCAFQAQGPVAQADAIGIVAGPDGVANSVATGDDDQLIAFGTTGLPYGAAVVGPGPDDFVDTVPAGDDVYESLSSIPPATDPSQRDTDVDNVTDGDELFGYDIGLAIVDGGNGTAETQRNGDDIQKAFYNNPVFPGGIVILPGPNGVIDSTPGPDDVVRPAATKVTDPLRRDTDSDTVADGLEQSLGADPTNAADGADFRDGDQDGLTDAEEANLGWLVSVNGGPAIVVKSSPSLPDTDFDGLPDFVERDLRTNPNLTDTDGDGLSDFDELADFARYVTLTAQFPGVVINGSNSARYGTNPAQRDSDGDGLSDYEELITGYQILLAGESSFRLILTNPLAPDTDVDGVFDYVERANGTDATDPDTDDDGKTDGREASLGTNPLEPDVSITVKLNRLSVDEIEDPGGSGGAEFGWWIVVRANSLSTSPHLLSSANQFANDDVCVSGDCSHQQDYDPGPDEVLVGLLAAPYPENQVCYFAFLGDGTSTSNRWVLPLDNVRAVPVAGFGKVTFPLKAGQTFSVEGLIAEFDGASADCGLPPNYIPAMYYSGCFTRFDKSFSFSDFDSGSLGGSTIALNPIDGPAEGGDTCSWELEATIEAQ